MNDPLTALFQKPAKTISKEEIAEMLKTTPEAIEKFETAYRKNVLSAELNPNNAKAAAARNARHDFTEVVASTENIISRIVTELLAQTEILCYDGKKLSREVFSNAYGEPVSLEEVNAVDADIRPQLTGNLMARQINGDTARTLLGCYKKWQTSKNQKEKQLAYGMFRKGLDMLDLDEITWHILGMNKNAMGYWFPHLIQAVENQGFFKVPATKIAKVPVTLLQLTRIDYENLTWSSRQIANRFCMEAFDLDENKDYFIKTGTFSSKFDFRNAKVTGASEVHTLGEYLLFIQNQAVMMAGNPGHCMYGVSTTNEWVVREFIQDVENNPRIYMGMPLHTEYRVFADFDENKIMGITPYWRPDVMKHRFADGPDADTGHMRHDWVTYSTHEDTLMARYAANKNTIVNKLAAMLPDFELTGQWSIDIMQNGTDFYIIDMALAQNSALSDCLAPGSLKPVQEDWLPKLN